MYRFAPLPAPLNRLFVSRGFFPSEGHSGAIIFRRIYSFELVWRLEKDGSLGEEG